MVKKRKKMNISYAITVKDELEEIKQLLNFLQSRISSDDEIVVQQDLVGSNEVKNFLNSVDNIHVIQYPLNLHFANFKNNLNKHCTKTYICQLDADELISEYLLQNIHTILESNNVDLYWIPRINTVEGLTQEHIQQWKWRVNEQGWVNFPDFQSRIYKNIPEIKWKYAVHEIIDGHKSYAYLPDMEQYALIHRKTITKQELQNQMYSKMRRE